jgi:putative cell wall-binding protein
MIMKKNNKKFLSACGVATLVASTVVPATAAKAASVDRLGGSDRYETAAAVSKSGWTSSDYVVIANGDSYSDSLCAVPLAKSKNAPILLTQGNSLNSTTLSELKRLNAKHVIIVGGTGAVTEGVANSIKSKVTSNVERYGGADRFETSVKVASQLSSATGVFVANGLNFPDALSAAPVAAIKGQPIILTRSTALPDSVSSYIKGNSKITKSYLVGGTGVVTDSVFNSLPGAERYGGSDRYETNKDVIEAFKGSLNFDKVYVARGDDFPDSLTGGSLAAKNKSALVITATGSASEYTKSIFKNLLNKNTKITALGGSAVLSDSILSNLEDSISKSGSSGGSSSSGGSDTDNGNDTTADVIDMFTDNNKSGASVLQDKLNNSSLAKYFDANVTSNSITLNTRSNYKDKLSTPLEVMSTIKQSDNKADIKEKLDNAYSVAEEHINSIIAGSNDKNFKEILTQIKNNNELGKYTKYVNEDGTVNTEKLAEDIYDKDLTEEQYETYLNGLEDRIVSAVKENEAGVTTSPSIKYSSLAFYKLDKDDSNVYNTSVSKSDNISKIFKVSKIQGTYKLYYGSNKYVVVTVK